MKLAIILLALLGLACAAPAPSDRPSPAERKRRENPQDIADLTKVLSSLVNTAEQGDEGEMSGPRGELAETEGWVRALRRGYHFYKKYRHLIPVTEQEDEELPGLRDLLNAEQQQQDDGYNLLAALQETSDGSDSELPGAGQLAEIEGWLNNVRRGYNFYKKYRHLIPSAAQGDTSDDVNSELPDSGELATMEGWFQSIARKVKKAYHYYHKYKHLVPAAQDNGMEEPGRSQQQANEELLSYLLASQ